MELLRRGASLWWWCHPMKIYGGGDGRLARNDERGRKPCTKRSPGWSGIEKRRKITKYWSIGLIAVRDGGVGNPPRYAMIAKYLRFLRKSSRYAKPFWAPRRGTRRVWRWNDLILLSYFHEEFHFITLSNFFDLPDEKPSVSTIKTLFEAIRSRGLYQGSS
ncbi:hypothetical protein E3N88_35872 [Mikania micrantha]|uniref:Uncharacterized protein n=1 Tax=Mikania micrantha TaxID=192012 RepID=A0A5N6M2H8_9ASTR|nr:hypothetical protein E3N88_35872 [Mikania micrantha]